MQGDIESMSELKDKINAGNGGEKGPLEFSEEQIERRSDLSDDKIRERAADEPE